MNSFTYLSLNILISPFWRVVFVLYSTVWNGTVCYSMVWYGLYIYKIRGWQFLYFSALWICPPNTVLPLWFLVRNVLFTFPCTWVVSLCCFQDCIWSTIFWLYCVMCGDLSLFYLEFVELLECVDYFFCNYFFKYLYSPNSFPFLLFWTPLMHILVYWCCPTSLWCSIHFLFILYSFCSSEWII